MTLLDPKHLVAPFKNTIHLSIIVGIILLFLAFRATTSRGIRQSDGASNAVTSGEGANSNRSKNNTERVQEEQQNEIDPLEEALKQRDSVIQGGSKANQRNSNNRDSLDEELSKQIHEEPAPRKENQVDTKNLEDDRKVGQSLEDIERQLEEMNNK